MIRSRLRALADALLGRDRTGRAALVLGNDNYPDGSLGTPVRDAKAIADALHRLGYKVFGGAESGTELTAAQMSDLFEAFKVHCLKWKPTATVIYYSGHGVQKDDVNYIVPLNGNRRSGEGLIPIQPWIGAVSVKSTVTILILDACREPPDGAEGAVTADDEFRPGQALMSNERNRFGGPMFVAFAAEPGKSARAGLGKLSVYTGALVPRIGSIGVSVNDLMLAVADDVVRATDQRQTPWSTFSITKPFFFNPSRLVPLWAGIISVVLSLICLYVLARNWSSYESEGAKFSVITSGVVTALLLAVALVLALNRSPRWRRMRPWFLPATAVVWGLAMAFAIPTLPVERESNMIFKLQQLVRPTGSVSRDDRGLVIDPGAAEFQGLVLPMQGFRTIATLDLSGAAAVPQEVSRLSNLEGIDLTNLQQIDLDALDHLGRLTTLYLRRQQTYFDGTAFGRPFTVAMPPATLAGLEVLNGLDKLETLDLSNQAMLIDLAGLRHVPNLRTLILAGAVQASNLLPLAGLSKLEHLDILDVPVTDLSPLAALPLESLALGGAGDLPDLIPLSGSHYLRDLFVDGALGAEDLERLGVLPALESLDAGRIDDLRPLAGFVGLRDLFITDASRIADLEPLRLMTELESLDIRVGPGVVSVEPLGALSSLEDLRLTGAAGITDFRPLGQLDELRWLFLAGTTISDFSWLSGLTKLEELVLRDCICDVPSLVSAVRGLESLEWLDLPGLSEIERDAIEQARPGIEIAR